METNVSNFAYGAGLSQKQEDGKYHPVAYMSKSMLPAERNYDTFDKEALGIVKPLQHWRYWLQGTKKPIQIITDHKNLLTGFNDRPTPSKRHLRWVEALRHFNYIIGYRSGKKNTVADPLSRQPDHHEGGEEEPWLRPFTEEKMRPIEELDLNLVEVEIEDQECEAIVMALLSMDGDIQEEIRQWLEKNPTTVEGFKPEEGLLTQEGRIWVPPENEIRRKLVELYHNSPLTGHLGVGGTLDIVS
jgi:hypothetical protein